MPRTSLASSQLPHILMPRTSLEGSNFDRGNFNHSSFRKANLCQTSWQQTQAEAAIFIKANLPESNFTQANLTNADFTQANLTNANFTNANLAGANFSQTCLQGAIFRNANLKQAKLYDADIAETSFDGTDCSDTYFTSEQTTAGTTENFIPDSNDSREKTATFPANHQYRKTQAQSPFVLSLPQVKNQQYSFFLSHRGLQGKRFWRNLPRKFLLAWGLGYFLLAQGMVYYQVGWEFWLLAIFSSFMWWLDEQLLWFLPMAVFFAIFSNDPIVIRTLLGFVPLTILVTVFYWFQWGWHLYRSLKLSLFIAGAFVVSWIFLRELLLVASWLDFFLFLQFILSVVGITAGSFSIVEMGNRGYSKKQTLPLIVAIAVLGLALGRIVS
ncbi:pentapeptide repeat-containing protein [Geitlerinema sp. PCC 9228]|uniref:pentapeptide repeat-containing protein n=1 Tax=Geitlerinema sp. PCC 9228 TaxID=111611 RepID=UPI0008F9C6A9|nr:pentapeptide repeat-containing protein [Geitlerinema sp. PCC 9228]